MGGSQLHVKIRLNGINASNQQNSTLNFKTLPSKSFRKMSLHPTFSFLVSPSPIKPLSLSNSAMPRPGLVSLPVTIPVIDSSSRRTRLFPDRGYDASAILPLHLNLLKPRISESGTTTLVGRFSSRPSAWFTLPVGPGCERPSLACSLHAIDDIGSFTSVAWASKTCSKNRAGGGFF